jgi:GNAT superfamily N-acetyltransferase
VEPARVAGPDDVESVTDTVWRAFLTDPLWHWVFGDDEEGPRRWWRFLVQSAVRYPWVRIVGDFAAVAVWIPPGGVELTEEEEERVEPLMQELVGARCAEVLELLERFEGSHPGETPHYYLSLLATDPRSRGRGIGMQLLAENLSLIDAEGTGAYLESSNPANDRRYERLGFARAGAFSTPDGAHTVTTMWRQPLSGPPASRRAPA